ncbi:hypothetical protein ACIPSA_19690 [Streptomyces sp. NPDC086549]|uniref:hypothetical protein n=1 Tax=Streptomyces sp. NPDC086549 TaxID=3365752 RepID=UPI0037F97A3C
MEDLADEGCVVPIIIRCPGHLWSDGKFGQIGDPRDLAGPHVLDRRFHAEILLPTPGRGPQDLPMTTTDAFLPPTSAAVVVPVRVQQQPGRPRRPDSARS